MIWPGQDFKGQDHLGNVKGHIKVTPQCSTFTPRSNNPAKYQGPTPSGFPDNPQQYLMIKVTTARSKVK